MKRNACIAALAACIAAGGVRFWDLLANSEAATGFVTLGSVWVRYGVLALLILGIVVLARVTRAKQPLESLAVPLAPLLGVLAALALCTSWLGVQYAVNEFARPTTSLGHAEGGEGGLMFAFGLRLAFAVSLLLFGVWCAAIALRKEPLLRPKKGLVRALGFCGVMAFGILPLLRYAENPASAHRIVRILPICSALAAMLFVVKLLGTLCVPLTPTRRAELAAAGLCAFLLCTCLEGPQMLWQMAVSKPTALERWTSGTLGLLGIMGAAVAVVVSEAHSAKKSQAAQ